MRNSTVIAFGVLAAMAMPAAATVSPQKLMKDVKTRLIAKAGGKEIHEAPARKASGVRQKVSELAGRMKPGVTRTFGWDGEDWIPEDTYTYAYDSEGNVTSENAVDAEGICSRTVYEYDSNGMVTFKQNMVAEDGVSFEFNSKTEFKYDPILTKVIVDRGEWLWQWGEWQQRGNNYRRIITRDIAGNITSSVIAVLFQGIYDPTIKVEVTYGEDGKATEISEQVLNFDYETYEYFWEQGVVISDIVWDRTDGQIYDPEAIFLGSNRIGAAHYIDPDGLDMNITVEYADDSDAYTATMEMTMDGMSVTGVTEYTPLENDGYSMVATTYFMDEVLSGSYEEYRYDDWGLMTMASESETEEGFTYGEKTIGEVEYDSEGKPTTYTVSQTFFEMDEEETEYVIRAEYSDYVDVTVGSGVGIDVTESVDRYYDLNGVRAVSPGKGRIVVTESGSKIKY